MTITDSRHHDGWFDHLINGFAIIAGFGMCALTVLVCFDVAVRNFHLFAMPWSLEVAEYSLLLITFLGAPWVLETGGHISIDIVVDRLDAAARRRMRTTSYAVGALVCALLLFASCVTLWKSYSDHTMIMETLEFPEWVLFLLPPPIFLMLMGIFLRWLRSPPEARQGLTSSDGF
ncbi:MAG: TRAP transporter small permease [Rhodospirillales bacterium]|nr:TRAP transporter small permease [Rhodospirillales bacterium]